MFGVVFLSGGKYIYFGMYNYFLGLVDGFYLEVIFIDLDVLKSGYLWWFDLDCFVGVFCISNWICWSEDLVGEFGVLLEGVGVFVVLMCGDLVWWMVVLVDGILFCDGCFFVFI